jgi:hypothetical protein
VAFSRFANVLRGRFHHLILLWARRWLSYHRQAPATARAKKIKAMIILPIHISPSQGLAQLAAWSRWLSAYQAPANKILQVSDINDGMGTHLQRSVWSAR